MNRRGVRLAGLAILLGVSLVAVWGVTGESRGADAGDVRFATVAVNVTDKGQPVTGLNKEDFQLVVDGKPQPILSFEAVTGESGTSGGFKRGKVVLILFDAHAMGPSHAQISQVAAEKYVQKHIHPQDLVAVAVYGRKLEILQSFTNNVDTAIGAIRRPLTTFGETRLETGFRGNEGQQIAKNAIRSLTSLCQDLAQLDGRKSVLVFSQDFWAPGGEEYPRLVDTARRTKVSFYTLITTAASARSHPDKKQRPDAEETEDEEADQATPARLKVAARPLPGFTPDAFMSPVTAFQQQGGGPPDHPLGPTGGIADPSTRDSATMMDQANANADLLQALAKETNGDVVRESNNLTEALNEFDRAIGNYYILGFLASGKGDRHKVEIKTVGKGARLSYAKQYYAPANQELKETQATRSLAGALQSAQSTGAISVELQPVVFYRTRQVADVICYFKLKREQLKFNKKEADSPNHVTVMAAAVKEDGGIAGRYQASLEMPESGSRPLHAQMTLPAGKYRIRIGVADEGGQVGIAETPIEFAELPAGKLASSSLIVSAQLTPLPELIRGAPSQLVGEDYPLVFKGYEVTGSVDNRANRAKPLALYFNLYNLPDLAGIHELVSDARFTDETGQSTLLAPVKHIRTAEPVGTDRVALGFTVPVNNLRPGKYRVTIYTRDAANKNSTSCEADVILE